MVLTFSPPPKKPPSEPPAAPPSTKSDSVIGSAPGSSPPIKSETMKLIDLQPSQIPERRVSKDVPQFSKAQAFLWKYSLSFAAASCAEFGKPKENPKHMS